MGALQSAGERATESATASATDSATFGGGCFWCLEAVFDSLAGVQQVASGYCGGPVATPSYEAVCGGNTGHAEVVTLQFDPSVISYRDLLAVFFTIHDPTTPNRQGNDVGSQYRSVIFAHSPEQAATAAEVIAELEAAQVYDDPIVTEVVPPVITGHDILAGRGLPSGILRAQRQAALLPDGRRAQAQ